MLSLENEILDISETKLLASKFCKDLKVGDVLLLKGDLGVGKTTFAKFIIRNLYKLSNLTVPSSITSPTFPIMLSYELENYEIHHYDLYRIKNIKELDELDFFENIQNSITLIEWPELLINLPFKNKHYLINFDIFSETKRVVNIEYFKK